MGSAKRSADELLDAQNREHHERLSSKASYLKSIAFDMEMEAKDQNRLLSYMGDDFDSSSTLLGGSVSKVKNLLASGRGNRRLTLYIALAVVFCVFVLYYLFRKLVFGASA